MTEAEAGLLNSQVQAAIRLVSAAAGERFRQINFFRKRGFKCSRLKSALKLGIHDLRQLGFNCDDGIVAPDGERLWPK